MLEFAILFLVGIVAATFGSIVGLGGGIIIVPVLLYFGPALVDREIDVAIAVGTSLAVLIFTALASTTTFIKQRKIDYKSGWIFFICSGPGAIAGAALVIFFNVNHFLLGFGVFMLVMAALMMLRDRLKPLRVDWRIKRTYTDASGLTLGYGYNLVPALMIGLAVGILSGMFGIGGGSLFVPLMVLIFAFPPHVAAATSMFVILLSSFAGTAMHIYLGNVDIWLLAALAPGAWLGGKLGAAIAGRMSSNALLWVLRVTLFVVAMKMIYDGWSGM